MRYLVTGAAGFIGNHVALALLDAGHEVLGVDSVNAYYEPSLKEARLKRLIGQGGWSFERLDIADKASLDAALDAFRPERFIHLAAQAGVRYSVENPEAYTSSNLVGFANILEAARRHKIDHLVFASTSSAYGANGKTPFEETQGAAHPLSYYAATKQANEAMAHAYAYIHALPCTGLRFFTVYGPWGRPDMALFKFTKAMLEGRAIDVYNHGDMARDFTYIGDIVEGVVRIAERPAAVEPTADMSAHQPPPDRSAAAPFRLYNIGRGAPVQLMDFIRVLEKKLGVAADINFMPMQLGDVPRTSASTVSLAQATGYKPATSLEDGVSAFVDWYRGFYGV